MPASSQAAHLPASPFPAPAAVATAFNDCINARDLDGLAALMADDHRFTDMEGASVLGKAACVRAWRGFFDAYPDYRNVFHSMSAADDRTVGAVVDIAGRSECSEPALCGPARWTALVRDGAVVHWHVHA